MCGVVAEFPFRFCVQNSSRTELFCLEYDGSFYSPVPATRHLGQHERQAQDYTCFLEQLACAQNDQVTLIVVSVP